MKSHSDASWSCWASFYLSLKGFGLQSPHYRKVGAHRRRCYIVEVTGCHGCIEAPCGSLRCPLVTCFQGKRWNILEEGARPAHCVAMPPSPTAPPYSDGTPCRRSRNTWWRGQSPGGRGRSWRRKRRRMRKVEMVQGKCRVWEMVRGWDEVAHERRERR